MLIQRHRAPAKQGQAAITVVILFLVGSLIVIGGISFPIVKEIQAVGEFTRSKQSYYLAEAGLEDAAYRIRKGKQIDIEETVTLSESSAITTISDISSSEKQIIAVGDVDDRIRIVSTNLSTAIGISFFYGVQAGEGGIEMDENSSIQGTGGSVGNVYSNGPIIGSNGATITGDTIVAGGLEEDNQARSLVCNQDQIVGQADPQIDFAQSFTPGDSQPLAKVSLYIKKVGNPADRDVRIVADNGGVPDNDYLTKGKLKSSLVGSEYGWIDITFSNPTMLVQGQTYWIVLDANRSSNRYWIWCKDSNQGYGNGVGMYSEDWDDDPWTLIIGDLTFRTFLGVGATSIDNVNVGGTAKANTITNSTIGGDAYYQTITSSTVTGTSYPGSTDPPVSSMPISDANITDWKNDAGCGVQPAVPPCLYIGNYSVTADVSLGPLTITGDLLMQNNNMTLTVEGTIFVEGNLDVENGSTIQCAASFGTDSCIVLTDGWIHIKNNGTFRGSGTAGSYIMMLSTLACTGSSGTNCTDHTGSMDLHNNASGAIFYATNGQINLHNGVNATEVTGYKIRLDNTATITYEQGLINSNFSSGPSGSWGISSWLETE